MSPIALPLPPPHHERPPLQASAADHGIQPQQTPPTMGPYRIVNVWGGSTPSASETHFEISTQSSLFEAMCAYIKTHSAGGSYRVADPSLAGTTEEEANKVELRLAFGEFELEWEGRAVTVSHQGFGEPHWAGGFYATLVLAAAARDEPTVASLSRLCAQVMKEHAAAAPARINLFSFNAKSQHWSKEASRLKRRVSSVILPEETLQQVLDDAASFTAPSTRAWYEEHGISYKRTFLLFGPPGCGKSSLITAVASELGRNVCFLSLADRDLTDNSLRKAVSQAPRASAICLEDVDALFHHREKTDSGSTAVTFSGLLNALDGVGDASGTLFFLTTNHKERLDGALIRPGRVDVQVRLDYASNEQVGKMLRRFYAEASDDDCAAFVKAVRASEGGRRVTMAQLQEHFVQHRTSTLVQALDPKALKLGASVDDNPSMWS